MQTKEIGLQAAENLIDRYVNAGGSVIELNPGSLGLGTVILANNGLKLKEFVIVEQYLSAWASRHIIRIYTKGLPKKYQTIVNG